MSNGGTKTHGTQKPASTKDQAKGQDSKKAVKAQK